MAMVLPRAKTNLEVRVQRCLKKKKRSSWIKLASLGAGKVNGVGGPRRKHSRQKKTKKNTAPKGGGRGV